MRVSDLIRAAGGLDDSAYGNAAELTSYTVVGGEKRRADVKQIDLGAVRRGDVGANVLLRPYDVLTIQVTPEWGRLERIELVGEVKFPGTYQIRRGETLASVLERAGGLTPLAFVRGAIFTREDLKMREKEQRDRLAARMQSDLAALSLQSAQSSTGSTQALSAGQALLDQLRQAAPVGRLVIDLDGLSRHGGASTNDITLRNGDRLLVPRVSEEVSVLGEVQNSTSHLYREGMTRDEVIALSGGMTQRADKRRVYIVRADGSVVSSRPGWLSSGNIRVLPGDSVVVPLDAERMRPLPLWTSVTTIVYNLAIAAAAVARL